MSLEPLMIRFLLEGAVLDADVLRVRLVEGLSELFEAEVTLTLPLSATAAPLTGKRCVVECMRGEDADAARRVHGVVMSAERLDEGDGRNLQRPLYRLFVVPRVWGLTLPLRTRVFVDRKATDIVAATASDAGLSAPRMVLGSWADPMMPLAVQYQETDYDLLDRLLTQAGLTHYVEHTSSGDRWVLLNADPDSARLGEARPLIWSTLVDGQADREGVLRASRLDAMDTTTTLGSDTDRRTAVREWTASGQRGAHGAAREERALERVGLERAGDVALRLTDARRPLRERYTLETNDLHLRPGECVDAELSQADAADAVLTRLLVVRVEHELELGTEGVVYRNVAEAVTIAEPYRPARVRRRSTILAPQTGVVTAYRAGKLLEVDVTMDWGAAEDTVIPVRVPQPIAGAEHGSVLLPRLGSEVLVHFIDGAPERPVLIGALYHDAMRAAVDPSATPWLSRFQMMGESGPTNLVEVDDAGGAEKVLLSAFKDVVVKIGGTETRTVKGDVTETLQAAVTVDVKGKRTSTLQAGEQYESRGAVTVTLQKSGRVLVNDTLQMTADTKLSLVSGNTRADFTPSSAKIAVGGSVVEISPAVVKVSTGGASIEMSAGQIKITAPMVSLNNGALTVV